MEGSHCCAAVLLVESENTGVLCLKPAILLVLGHQRNSLELGSRSSEVSGCTTPPQHKPPVGATGCTRAKEDGDEDSGGRKQWGGVEGEVGDQEVSGEQRGGEHGGEERWEREGRGYTLDQAEFWLALLVYADDIIAVSECRSSPEFGNADTRHHEQR